MSSDDQKLRAMYPKSKQAPAESRGADRPLTDQEKARRDRLDAAGKSAKAKAKADRELSKRLATLYPSHAAKQDRWNPPLSEAEQDALARRLNEGDEMYPSHIDKGW